MKKQIIAALVGFLLASVMVYAVEAPIKMQEDKSNRPVPGIAPDYRKDVILTGKSQVVEVTRDLAWKAYTATDAVYRTMSSSTKTGIAHTHSGGSWGGEVVNHSTSRTFLNFTGATGTLRRQ